MSLNGIGSMNTAQFNNGASFVNDNQAKCAYCGRYGPLGACDGCGAPNAPSQSRIERTSLQSAEREFVPATPLATPLPVKY